LASQLSEGCPAEARRRTEDKKFGAL